MSEFVNQLSTLALIVILLAFGFQTYRIIYGKLCKLDQRQPTQAPSEEPAVRRRHVNNHTEAYKEIDHD